MYHDLDAVIWQAEQKMGFDDFERLVGQRGAIHGNLAAHPPGRMLKRISEGRALEPLAGPPAKGTARRGEHESPHLGRRTTGETLKNRAVFAIHRHELATTTPARLGDE